MSTEARKLSTIQKREKLNDVYAMNERGNGGANHTYAVHKCGNTTVFETEPLAVIQFQDGARKIPDSTPGVLDTDLLEIVRDRLKGFRVVSLLVVKMLVPLLILRKLSCG